MNTEMCGVGEQLNQLTGQGRKAALPFIMVGKESSSREGEQLTNYQGREGDKLSRVA